MVQAAYTKARPCWLSKPAVESLAESIAQQLGYVPGGDLLPVLEKLGGTLVPKDFWNLHETDSGSIYIEEPHKFYVSVSSNSGGMRDRFTIAHEIGHYILHYMYPKQTGVGDDLKKVYATRYGSEREEWEANWFAASFLMPKEAFRASLKRNSGNIDLVAAEFGVSRMAASTRAKALSHQ